MTRSQLIKALAAKHPSLPAEAIDEAVRIIFSTMMDALKEDKKIELRGFGSFFTRLLKSRKGRHPKNASVIDLPERRIAKFRPSRQFLAILNQDDKKQGQ